MAIPYDDELHRAADGILESAMRRETWRARRARFGPRLVRLAVLLALVVAGSLVLTGTVLLVEVLFFAVLGASAIFRAEPSPTRTGPPNRTRAIGRTED
ncbi:MAG TPA: hypothetical protein VK277_08995 [Acidimicrobiales bacterium]|nr:hypothetical protein [Acidimicrobiales bacterium]